MIPAVEAVIELVVRVKPGRGHGGDQCQMDAAAGADGRFFTRYPACILYLTVIFVIGAPRPMEGVGVFRDREHRDDDGIGCAALTEGSKTISY